MRRYGHHGQQQEVGGPSRHSNPAEQNGPAAASSNKRGSPIVEDESTLNKAGVGRLEGIIESFRIGMLAKGAAIIAIVTAIKSSNQAPETQASACSTYVSLIDSVERQLNEQNEGGRDVGRGLQERLSTIPQERSRHRGSHHRDMPPATYDKQVHRPITRREGSYLDSGSESEGDTGTKRKRRITEDKLPWFKQEKLARETSDPSTQYTRKILELFARDYSAIERDINNAQTAPSGFPSSEWKAIIRGQPVNLDVILSGLHHVAASEEKVRRTASEISLGRINAACKVETFGQWVCTWNICIKAVMFVFPHREDELRTYGEYMSSLFSSHVISLHYRVIMFDKAIREEVGGGQRLLLTDTNRFSHLGAAILHSFN